VIRRVAQGIDEQNPHWSVKKKHVFNHDIFQARSQPAALGEEDGQNKSLEEGGPCNKAPKTLVKRVISVLLSEIWGARSTQRNTNIAILGLMHALNIQKHSFEILYHKIRTTRPIIKIH